MIILHTTLIAMLVTAYIYLMVKRNNLKGYIITTTSAADTSLVTWGSANKLSEFTHLYVVGKSNIQALETLLQEAGYEKL